MKHDPIVALKRHLIAFDYVCSGSLLHRRLVCGKGNCRCKAKPPFLHGPYYYWSRKHKGRLVSRVLSASQARIIRTAIQNNRKALKLLRQWEAQTVRIIERHDVAGKS